MFQTTNQVNIPYMEHLGYVPDSLLFWAAKLMWLHIDKCHISQAQWDAWAAGVAVVSSNLLLLQVGHHIFVDSDHSLTSFRNSIGQWISWMMLNVCHQINSISQYPSLRHIQAIASTICPDHFVFMRFGAANPTKIYKDAMIQNHHRVIVKPLGYHIGFLCFWPFFYNIYIYIYCI